MDKKYLQKLKNAGDKRNKEYDKIILESSSIIDDNREESLINNRFKSFPDIDKERIIQRRTTVQQYQFDYRNLSEGQQLGAEEAEMNSTILGPLQFAGEFLQCYIEEKEIEIVRERLKQIEKKIERKRWLPSDRFKLMDIDF